MHFVIPYSETTSICGKITRHANPPVLHFRSSGMSRSAPSRLRLLRQLCPRQQTMIDCLQCCDGYRLTCSAARQTRITSQAVMVIGSSSRNCAAPAFTTIICGYVL